jgi:hypothetical protein
VTEMNNCGNGDDGGGGRNCGGVGDKGSSKARRAGSAVGSGWGGCGSV